MFGISRSIKRLLFCYYILIKKKKAFKLKNFFFEIMSYKFYYYFNSDFIRTIANISDNYSHRNELILKQYLNFKFSKNDEFTLPTFLKKIDPEICLHFEKYFNIKYLDYSNDFSWKHWKYDQKNLINNNFKGNLNHIFNCENKSKKIFVSRYNDKRRFIDKDHILYDSLKNINPDIEYVNLNNTKMNLLENAKFFSKYNILISSHGAVLGNMIYMPEKSLIIEIVAKNSGKKSFSYLANRCNHTYFQYEVNNFRKSKEVYSWPKDSILELETEDIDNISDIYKNYLSNQA